MTEKFDINEFSQWVRVSRREGEYSYGRSQIYEVSAYFAKGKQIRTFSEEKKRVHKTIDIPVTPIDWLKSLIIIFEPTLNFGWLKPNYRTLEKEVTIQIKEEYINVYPIELSNPALRDRCLFFPSPYSWLMGEPPTQDDVHQARLNVDKLKWSATQLAPWLMDKDATRDFKAKEYISRTSR